MNSASTLVRCFSFRIDSTGDVTPQVYYEYDFAGRRISKHVNGVTTKYCYDGDQIIAEYAGSDTLLGKFVCGPGIDEPICMVDVTGGILCV